MPSLWGDRGADQIRFIPSCPLSSQFCEDLKVSDLSFKRKSGNPVFVFNLLYGGFVDNCSCNGDTHKLWNTKNIFVAHHAGWARTLLRIKRCDWPLTGSQFYEDHRERLWFRIGFSWANSGISLSLFSRYMMYMISPVIP
jgi:hypothetical protein